MDRRDFLKSTTAAALAGSAYLPNEAASTAKQEPIPKRRLGRPASTSRSSPSAALSS